MINSNTMEITDDELVNDCLAGNRDAFEHIVTRYQSLICSIAYSGLGDLTQSEDLAQDTFLAAWKQLRNLREPHKLRSWLCGIARNLTCDALKKQGREPSHEAQPLEELSESHAPGLQPHDFTISNEEASILWRSLERIPELYREPLVLFYRQHQSVEAVAKNLDLSEDTVKQRLSRGRKLLHEQVLALVQSALERTNPGKFFTVAVVSALPAMTISAKAASLGAVAIKGAASAKTAAATGFLGAFLGPLLAIFGNYASYRMSMDEAHTEHERENIKSLFKRSLFLALGLSLVLGIPLLWVLRSHHDTSLFLTLLFSLTIVIYFLSIFGFAFGSLGARRRYLAKTLADDFGGVFPSSAYEYRSPSTLFGLPLVHVRIGDRFDVLRGPVKAWIAIGSSHAVGLIFASGGIAIAPISFGGIAIGLVPIGAVAIGLFSLGACSLGIFAFGGLAVGWQIYCGFGLAWNAAMGGVTLARDFAIGGFAHAPQANTELANQFFLQQRFFKVAAVISSHPLMIMLLSVIPAVLQARIVKKARKSTANHSSR